MRIAHLVDELFGDGLHRHPPTGVVVLGDDERPVGRGIDDGVADIGQVLDGAPIMQAVATG
jgi:hypothetical protein